MVSEGLALFQKHQYILSRCADSNGKRMELLLATSMMLKAYSKCRTNDLSDGGRGEYPLLCTGERHSGLVDMEALWNAWGV